MIVLCSLFGALVINVSTCIQKLLTVIGDNITELDAHLAPAPMELTAMSVDPETIQASLILMSSFTRNKIGTLSTTTYRGFVWFNLCNPTR